MQRIENTHSETFCQSSAIFKGGMFIFVIEIVESGELKSGMTMSWSF